MGEVLRKFSINQVMEIYESISFQSSVRTYRSVSFQSSVKLVMEIYGSVSEAGEFGQCLTIVLPSKVQTMTKSSANLLKIYLQIS